MKAALSIALYLQEVTTLFTITPKKKEIKTSTSFFSTAAVLLDNLSMI